MTCEKCGLEMMIDSEDSYTCVNPKCVNYRRIVTNEGTTQATIKKEK